MENPKFYIGELVRLRSGGPSMTIINIEQERKEEKDEHGRITRPHRKAIAYCRWFDGARMAQAPFPYESLICPESQPQPSLTPVDPATLKLQSLGKLGGNPKNS